MRLAWGLYLFLVGVGVYLAFGYPHDDPSRRDVVIILIGIAGYAWVGLMLYLMWSARR